MDIFMKRLSFCLWLITLMTVSIASASIISGADEITATANGISLPQGSGIVFREECDINSDGNNETVYVYGEKTDKEGFFNNLNAAVVSCDGLLRRTNYNGINGIDVAVFVRDYNSDGIKDVLLTAKEKGKINCMTADFSHSIPKNIMTDKALKGLCMKLSFTDGFKVWAELENGQIFSINAASSAQTLCEMGIFTPDGKYVTGTPVLSPVIEITPLEHDFGSNLLFTQKLYAESEEITLCNIEAEMEYTGDTLLIKRIEYYVD